MISKILTAVLILSFITPVFSQIDAGDNEKNVKNFSVKTTFAELLCSTETNEQNQQAEIVGREVNIMLDTSLDKLPQLADEKKKLALESNKKPENYKIIVLKTGETFELKTNRQDELEKDDEKSRQESDDPDTPPDIDNRLSFLVQPNKKYEIKPDENGKDQVTEKLAELLLIKDGAVLIGKEPGLGLISNNSVLENGAVKIVTTLTKIQISSSTCVDTPDKLPEPVTEEPSKETKSFLEYFAKAEKDEESKVNIKFSIDGSKRTRRYFTNDIDFRPFRIHRLGFGGAYDLIPFYLKLRYSGDPKSPVDTLEFGAKAIRHRVFNDDGKLMNVWEPHSQMATGWTLTLNPRIESDWKFKEVNFVTGLRLGAPLNLLQERYASLRLAPFVGLEAGLKLRSKANLTKENFIARPIFGADLTFGLFRNAEQQRPVVFEINYIRRLFLQREVSYGINAEGKEVVSTISRTPRDLVKATLTFNYNTIFSPFIEYTYGREPTKYILINSRFRAGIKLNFDWVD